MSRVVGLIFSALVIVLLLVDASVNLFAPTLLEAEMAAVGFSADLSTGIGLIVVICAVLYALPRTAYLGAILLTGFLGGAICAHYRVGEVFSSPQITSLVLGAATWLGLYLRDPRVRALLTGGLR
ncbi:DoxX family protein [Rhizobium johnstonii]|uniref:DoxX family protein n=1 Tax=Rhizobium TaxID=379 RepID=UPI00140FCF92|nr:DoxX family protein [Rhizobium leguminosarum]QIO63985.1 DoxX family protein [Rhizobium leguminosarum bv. trifolii]